MALQPKRVRFRKAHRGRVRGQASRGNQVVFGEHGLQSLDLGWVSARQIEAGRVAAQHFLGSEGKLWIRVFPDHPVTAKPAETAMGAGKGEPAFWVVAVKPGTILYEVGGVPEDVARRALLLARYKMPVRCRFVTRRARL